jgi:hypothetical protein
MSDVAVPKVFLERIPLRFASENAVLTVVIFTRDRFGAQAGRNLTSVLRQPTNPLGPCGAPTSPNLRKLHLAHNQLWRPF